MANDMSHVMLERGRLPWLPTKSKGEAKFAWPFNLTSGAVRRRQTTVWMHKTRRKEWDIYHINW